MLTRLFAAHVRWYLGHKRLARAISWAGLLVPMIVWWALFGLAAALIAEAVILSLAFVQLMVMRRLASKRQ